MASFVTRRALSTTVRRLAEKSEAGHAQGVLKEESRRNPELYILGGVMAFALGGAGLYFGRTPTKSTSEKEVGLAKQAMPWETDTSGKYKYHPGGNPDAEPKDAPSAINVVVVPDVNLPKALHEKYNKWGKDGY